ncbi:hypothetical protein, partial [Burkholderia ubonensis]|uniref:hypothetical protein n=1 Tax=Burkholderia ubonensis TaxID=101571 RepID=UPI001E53DDE8
RSGACIPSSQHPTSFQVLHLKLESKDDSAILQVTKCVNAAGLHLDWRGQGFRNAYFELNDEIDPELEHRPVI